MLGLRCARCVQPPVSSHAFPRTVLSGASPAAAPLFRKHTRFFASTPRHRKDDPRAKITQQEAGRKPEESDSTRPETLQKKDVAKSPGAETSNDALLSEQTVSNKQQRKADWAIIKEMSQYLWPKVGAPRNQPSSQDRRAGVDADQNNMGTRFRVGASVGLLIGAKVRFASKFLSTKIMYLASLYIGPQRPSPLLLQVHRRQHEH